jgi:hypothetical protein
MRTRLILISISWRRQQPSRVFITEFFPAGSGGLSRDRRGNRLWSAERNGMDAFHPRTALDNFYIEGCIHEQYMIAHDVYHLLSSMRPC